MDEPLFTPQGLAYYSHGDDASTTALVCIHGWGCRGSDFDALFRRLSTRMQSLRLLAPDLPGHGSSPATAAPAVTVSGFACAVNGLARDLGIRHVYLLGHSMGCRVAVEAVHLAPDLSIHGLVFLDGSNYSLRPGLYAFESNDPRSSALTAEQKAVKKAEMFQAMFSEATPPEFELAQLKHLRGLNRNVASAVREDYVRFDREDYYGRLEELGREGVALLNLQSTDIDEKNDRVRLKEGEMTKWMAVIGEKVPTAVQIVVTGCAHFPHVDQPEKVAKLIEDFIRRTGSR